MYRLLVSSFATVFVFVSSMLFVPLAQSQDVGAIAAAARPSVAALQATGPGGTLSGTGFVAAGGLVVTAYHLVQDATTILLKFPENPQVEAKLVGGDKDRDVAVLSVESLPVRPLPLGDIGRVQAGDEVVVIGYPHRGAATAAATYNIVSTVRPPIIQMQGPLTPGDSGGPVLNMLGEVVGIAGTISQGNFVTATSINIAKPLLGNAVLAPSSPPPPISATPAQPEPARSATPQHPNPGFEIEGWLFTGNLTYQTNFIDPTFGPGQSELVFPAAGTMPILRLNWDSITLRFGASSINQATSTDSDWIFNTALTNPVSVTQQSSSGNATFFSGDILLGEKGSDAQFYIGYELQTYNFTWTAPVVLTSCTPSPLIPTCPPLPFTEVAGPGAVLMYTATYQGPRIGLVGDWKMSRRASLSANLGYGFVNFNALDYHVLRNVTFPQSGSGSAFIGEVTIGYIFTDDLSVYLGYQYAFLHASGQTMVCSPAFSSTCSAPFTLTRADTTSQGATAGLLWKM